MPAAALSKKRGKKMQTEETGTPDSAAANIVSMDGYGSRRKKQIERQRGRIRTADDRFASLDTKSQSEILLHMIGYMEASKDLILAGRRVRPNEISIIFEVMENTINEASPLGNSIANR